MKWARIWQWLWRYARSLKGRWAYGDTPYQRGKNLTLIGAMALRGMIREMTLPGATDGLAFKTYVTQVLVPTSVAVAHV